VAEGAAAPTLPVLTAGSTAISALPPLLLPAAVVLLLLATPLWQEEDVVVPHQGVLGWLAAAVWSAVWWAVWMMMGTMHGGPLPLPVC